ncbi:phosphatidylglycerol:prolipoprotein diacylglycerol transferase [Chitinophaga sp. YR573]|uniref:prolipoprotein diacylglyceryl transferase n=1 Tax=Chitinophaga sp. YR573 TaxID=1881040 RepID=UPI0008B333B8|nr:prolipoprotein diacylglyceryl transferase family protein [Chitinophaga sp. YR573]SEW39009.1 phosphatidylglycerol:prolipoprotein diacylglycerol transferase [Chitinophaga sp. YR573]
MFPTIGDLFSYLFHVSVKVNLQTFGTLMALAFAGAYVVFVAEFKRKEADGTIRGIMVKETIGQSASPLELLLNTLLGFLLGYKVVDVLLALVHGVDPAPGFLSLRGNLAVGCLLALAWGIWAYTARRRSIPKETERYLHPYQLMPFIVFMVACWGFLGAKLFDAVEHIQELSYVPLQVLLARSGFTYYGGLIFGALTYLYIGYKHKIRLIHMADIGSPGMMLAYGIGRIGCQLSGDGDWGIVNRYTKPGWIPQWAWASTYPHNAIDAGIYIPGCTMEHCHQLPIGVYPTPLYESVICILLFSFLWMIRKRLKTPGMMFYLFLILNGVERFFIEQLRITPKYFLQLSQAQMIALLFIAGGLAGFVWLTTIPYFSGAERSPAKISRL